MDKVDVKIKEYLESKRRLSAGQRPGLYPGSEDIYAFVTDALEGRALERMLDHLKAHPEDQELVSRARQLLVEEPSAGPALPLDLVDSVKALHSGSRGPSASCPHCGKAITPFKKPAQAQALWNALWLVLAVSSLGASFAVKRYFIQFIALALLFGFKWIVDQKAARTQILIYKALRDGEEKSHLHRTSSHL